MYHSGQMEVFFTSTRRSFPVKAVNTLHADTEIECVHLYFYVEDKRGEKKRSQNCKLHTLRSQLKRYPGDIFELYRMAINLLFNTSLSIKFLLIKNKLPTQSTDFKVGGIYMHEPGCFPYKSTMTND
jgi:hypothetical protein